MGQNILVIEDDVATARLMKLQLGRQGFSVQIASNGFQGLKMVQTEPPDLILLDLMLPGMDGYEILNRLRAESPTANTPVVIVSAKSRTADKQVAAKIGATAYLTKPYLPEELVSLVQSLINEEQEETPLRGTCVALVAPQGGDAASVALYAGLALAGQDKTVAAVDLRPFSVTHSLLLELPPRSELASLSNSGAMERLVELTVRHDGGLRLLNNLEGSGDAGQLTPGDVQVVFKKLVDEFDFVLADVPLYPVDVLRQAAEQCAQLVLVTRGDPASLGATRSALTTAQRIGVDPERLGIVLVGSPDATGDGVELGHKVLGILPAGARPDAPAFHALAEWLISLT
jgi:DNA-binding response OmpR family regulator